MPDQQITHLDHVEQTVPVASHRSIASACTCSATRSQAGESFVLRTSPQADAWNTAELDSNDIRCAHVTLSDASYVALAEALQCLPRTADLRLAAAANLPVTTLHL